MAVRGLTYNDWPLGGLKWHYFGVLTDGEVSARLGAGCLFSRPYNMGGSL